MNKICFTKMVGSGNDFIVIQGNPRGNLSKLAKLLCDRRFGIGADGLLLLNKHKNADLAMRIFNADGSQAQMCGNGARCAAFFNGQRRARLFTGAGIINTEVFGNRVRIQLTRPKALKLDIPLKVNNRQIKVNFVNTGVPHTIIFVKGIAGINVHSIGSQIRRHNKFAPAGTNVNFLEVIGPDIIRIRTYERGVEGETLACGTGSTAAALIFALKNKLNNLVKVQTQGGETLKVYFKRIDDKFENVWLEGSAKIVYNGEYYV